ncbi:hypothetical protein XthCFBP4691_01120 [Xanthomonas theicola]|uniref:Uncharacterized protein n=1 Tax=Xanthomonas theicola TaxID=56464 RepID=A0A2S6ZLT7_9XANT|nr:hypothetical protein XthCFBP4691_01120 [Xanthomonas theicola]
MGIGAAAHAQGCCPSGGSGTPAGKVAATGLGESAPNAVDLSADPEWSVYEFEREGIRYVQINDLRGVVRAAAGAVGDRAWVMPMGTDVARVAIASDSQLGSVIYSSGDFEVRVIKGASGVSWVVTPRAAR